MDIGEVLLAIRGARTTPYPALRSPMTVGASAERMQGWHREVAWASKSSTFIPAATPQREALALATLCLSLLRNSTQVAASMAPPILWAHPRELPDATRQTRWLIGAAAREHGRCDVRQLVGERDQARS